MPFARQQLSAEDLYAPDELAFVDDFFDQQQNVNPPTVREKLASTTSSGQFVPVDTVGTILYPGADGGAEWGGAALDPRSAVLYVNSSEMAWIIRLGRADEKESGALGPRRRAEQSPLHPVPWRIIAGDGRHPGATASKRATER